MPKRNFENPENDEISNFYFDPVIIHLAGIRRRDRIKFIKKYKKIFIWILDHWFDFYCTGLNNN